MRQSHRLALKQEAAAAAAAAVEETLPDQKPASQAEGGKGAAVPKAPPKAKATPKAKPAPKAKPTPAPAPGKGKKKGPSSSKASASASAPPNPAPAPAPKPSGPPAPSFSFKKPPSSPSALPTTALAPGGTATAKPGARKRTKSAKARAAAEAKGEEGLDGLEYGNDPRHDFCELGPVGDCDVFASLTGEGEEETDEGDPSTDAALAYGQLTALVRAFAGAGSALPAFVDATPTHVPVLASPKEASLDWKGAGPGGMSLAAVRCLLESIVAHEAGGEVNYAVVTPVAGGARVEATHLVNSAHLELSSSVYLTAVGSKALRGVALTLELEGEDEPLRFLLGKGSLARIGMATAAAITRMVFTPLAQEEKEEQQQQQPAAGEVEAIVVTALHTGRVVERGTRKVVARSALGATGGGGGGGGGGTRKRKAPTAATAAKTAAAGKRGKKKKRAAHEDEEDEEDEEEGSDKEEAEEAAEPKKKKPKPAAKPKPKPMPAPKAAAAAKGRKALGDVTNLQDGKKAGGAGAQKKPKKGGAKK